MMNASTISSLRTVELAEGGPAAALFWRCFRQRIPEYPRHYVVTWEPSPKREDEASRVVAYLHQAPYEGVYLSGGLCVDERIYRCVNSEDFQALRRAGGLAAMILRDSMHSLSAAAAFAYVGEPRSRKACLRAGYEACAGSPHLMVAWMREVPADERNRLIEIVKGHGPF